MTYAQAAQGAPLFGFYFGLCFENGETGRPVGQCANMYTTEHEYE